MIPQQRQLIACSLLSLIHSMDGFALFPSSSSRHHPTPALEMRKNSDRAHIEKSFEDAMNNDWRVFRAQLVAKEAMESTSTSQPQAPSSAEDMGDEKLAKQGQLGDLFAGAISSIFTSKKGSNSESVNTNIFDGDSIGGCIGSEDFSDCEDPFVSEAELPLLLKSKVSVDKHRWAHSISHIEPGCVLVANEKLGGIFHQTVVLIIDHNEKQGSTGMIINRPMKGDLMTVASQPESRLDLSLKMAFSRSSVTLGGPVNSDEYSILHGFGEVEGSRKLCPGIFVGGSEELMSEVRLGSLDPRDALFVKGHAAWVGGQLTREIGKGVWYPVAASNDLILRYAGAPVTDEDNKDDLWSDILTCMGGSFAEIARVNSGHGDRRPSPPGP